MDITFGTDGWRAVLDKDFTGVNVERVTLAIGKYIADNFGFCKPILIGYDPRNKADEFSALCAELLKGKALMYFTLQGLFQPLFLHIMHLFKMPVQ